MKRLSLVKKVLLLCVISSLCVLTSCQHSRGRHHRGGHCRYALFTSAKPQAGSVKILPRKFLYAQLVLDNAAEFRNSLYHCMVN